MPNIQSEIQFERSDTNHIVLLLLIYYLQIVFSICVGDTSRFTELILDGLTKNVHIRTYPEIEENIEPC